MGDSLLYKVRSGKPVKFFDFLKNYMGLLIPDNYYRSHLKTKLEAARKRPDYEYILKSATIIQYTIKGRFMSR